MYASSSSQVAKTFRRSIHLHRLRSTKGFKLSFKLLLLDKNSYWARILKNSATMVSHQKYRIFFEFQFCVFLTNFSQNISQLVHYGKRTDDPFRKHILCLLWRNMSFILEVKLIITICDAKLTLPTSLYNLHKILSMTNRFWFLIHFASPNYKYLAQSALFLTFWQYAIEQFYRRIHL